MGRKKSYRPRLSEAEYRLIENIRRNPNSEDFLTICQEKGINPQDVAQYWDKDQRYSIQVKGSDKDWNGLIDNAFDRLKEYSPSFKTFKRTKSKDPHCLVLDPADIHIGKLASFVETGGKYDIETALARVDEGVQGVLDKSYGFNLDKVILIIGNDVLHIDNPHGTTTSGTRQDTSAMWHEMYLAAEQMYVAIIEKLLPICDIEVVYNPSNHDYASGFMLAQTIRAYFRKSNNVTFNVDISHRKYTQYGKSMIGTSHGDGAKMADMPLLMATENPLMWNECKYRYIYLHHIHHKQSTKWMNGKDYIGVTVEYLRSPSEADSWHDRNGYKGSKVGIEGFIHSFESGQVARITHLF